MYELAQKAGICQNCQRPPTDVPMAETYRGPRPNQIAFYGKL